MLGMNEIRHSAAPQQAAAYLSRARANRERALGALRADYIVTITEDGVTTNELVFPEPPSFAMLARIVPDAYLAEFTVRRRPRRPAVTETYFAAE